MGSLSSNVELSPLDLSLFLRGDEKQRRQFADDFCGCLKQHGFAKLVNHGLSDEAVKELYHWVR
jgi:isopenicillin N synthase-like dioxygenase